MNQKLSDWASIAEIIGALAIVISLIYVGIQVNESTRAVRSATANETTAAISAWYIEIGNNQQAAELYARGMADPESLSSGELAQFIYLTHGLILEYQAAYYLSEEGTLDQELRESITNNLAGVREMPGYQLYWSQRGSLFKPNFREFVDDILVNGATNTDSEALYRSGDSD